MASDTPPPQELSFREEGTGSAIVLLHGIAGDRLVWNAVVPALSEGHRVLAPDLSGHGATPLPGGSTCSFDELEQDVLGLLDRAGIASAHWVGLSAGAFLALRIALNRPERARTLTLVSGAAYCDAHQRAVMDRWWTTYDTEGPDAFALRLLKDLYYPDWIEAHLEVADLLREEVTHRNYTGARAWSRALSSFDEKNRIASLKLPTLMVQAMDDAVVDASHGRILRQTIPGAQIRILVQTGHLVPAERPDELVESVLGLIHKAEADPGRTPG
ncbi:MAG: alpha/beta fold hydrolase [Thermoplasmata archaeon]|nr:alpha/beta fold hydrolase [Thermoplasmata archaeon]